MIRAIGEFFGRIDNYTIYFDDLADRVERVINALRKHFGY